MAEWKKEQAVLEEKKKVERREERKAESKRRKLEKAKEKRKVQREELDRQHEWYASAKEAKKSGNLSGMGFLAAAAAAEAASTNNPASAAAAAPVPIAAARHPGHPGAALRHAYPQQPGASVLTAAGRVPSFPPSMPTQVDPFSHQALMRVHAAQGGTGTIDPASLSSADREFLQQALAQEARVREHLALARAEEEAALAQIRAQFHEQTRMRILAERERRLFLLQQLQARSGLPGGSAGAHSFLAHPHMAAPHHGAHPGNPNLPAYLTQAIRGGTGIGVAAAGAGNAAAPLAEVGVQPTEPAAFPTGVIPRQAPSAAIQEASTTENSQGPTSAEEAPGTGVAAADAGNSEAPQDVGVQPAEPAAFPTGVIPLQEPSAAVQEASTAENSQAPTSADQALASSPHEPGDQHIS